MTKTDSISELDIFLKEYQLKNDHGIAKFDARISILKKGNFHSLDSEIQVITSDGLASIYILKPREDDMDVPDMFDGKKFLFSFDPGRGLKISGETGNENVSISISPFIV